MLCRNFLKFSSHINSQSNKNFFVSKLIRAFHSTKSYLQHGNSSTNKISTVLNDDGSYLDFSVGLTSYFCLPEQGMKEYEMLSRASLSIVKKSKSSSKNISTEEGFQQSFNKYHFLGPAHVTHPWLYPRLYPEAKHPWLKFLREDAVRNCLTIREVQNIFSNLTMKFHTGEIMHEFELSKEYFRHPSHDLIALSLEDEVDFEVQLSTENIQLKTLDLDEQFHKDEEVVIIGHELVEKEKGEPMVPGWIEGIVNTSTPQRIFVRTKEPVPMGVCGGPVLNKAGKMIGIVEALVGKISKENVNINERVLKFWKEVENNTQIIKSSELKAFLHQIENK